MAKDEGERQKSMLAHLTDGVAANVWDNIPLGITISCPTLEEVLTADTYEDRVLGQSAKMTVPSTIVLCG
jgi:hypothetical protein